MKIPRVRHTGSHGKTARRLWAPIILAVAAATLLLFSGATNEIPVGREVKTDSQGNTISKLAVNSPTILQTLIDCPTGTLKLAMTAGAFIHTSPNDASATVGAFDQGQLACTVDVNTDGWWQVLVPLDTTGDT